MVSIQQQHQQKPLFFVRRLLTRTTGNQKLVIFFLASVLVRYFCLYLTDDDGLKLQLAAISSVGASPATSALNQPKGITGNLLEDTNAKKVDGEHVTTIGYAVSFLQCSSKVTQTSSGTLVDASLILRHSVHTQHAKSRYDYKMYALVHPQAVDCSKLLGQVGFQVIVVEPPVLQSEIQGEYLRKSIHKEWCCGADEFIKLHAYDKIPHDVVVHVDIDFAFYKPMDHLFDALVYDKDSTQGKAARQTLQLEFPSQALPNKIDAFITRDWAQVAPSKFPPGYQAGFLVARRDPSIVTEAVAIIKEGNYTDGWGFGSGWGRLGYGGFIGARAMQGLMAYYYDHIRPNTAVELNQCRFNHMGYVHR